MAGYGLEDEGLNAFFRVQGIFLHHLEASQQNFINSPHTSVPESFDKILRDENTQLKKTYNARRKPWRKPWLYGYGKKIPNSGMILLAERRQIIEWIDLAASEGKA
ncbi:hypothetical protein METHB2_680010 [Candidatus Methylobacter favarea]|uniref:Uncharacterized protein n=1 Tax=Candidatus Methylobacter favarea TaxID=2707345 RepID=A0A8S0WL33_9GAMM|nr:hypothetical protein [Candidatus Methylobacter favarea]CAA9892370.1 hypothetical protein METHB2_680010 [Candidatus Methylobacter favarea]